MINQVASATGEYALRYCYVNLTGPAPVFTCTWDIPSETSVAATSSIIHRHITNNDVQYLSRFAHMDYQP